jgi:poly(A) polymerase
MAKATSTSVIDMSTKIGGRTVSPALPVVDASDPTPLELSFNASLHQEYINDNIPMEPTEGIQRRERVLNRMGTLCRQWIQTVCTKRGLPKDVVQSAGGQLFTSGSYRLGVHEPGADIDTIVVAPNVCTRQDFFGTIETESGETERDPDSLAERIRSHPDVTNFVPVEGAAVPILTFDWEGVNIDLLFARLNSASVPNDFDIDNDAVLDGVDSATEKSLNGPRVTNLLAALVSGTPERYQTFLTVVRCVRKWAKARGLYSNKMGYWGGVNINIAVALCVQLYPRTPPASLLRKFFLVFRTWRWPNPVMLTKPHDAGYGLQVWSPQAHNARQVAPVVTPAYPAMNSTLAVSRQTLQIMHEEFCRGHEILDRIWKEHQANEKSGKNSDPNNTDPLQWEELFRPSDFFIAYPHYLSLCIVGPTQADAQAWAGFVESRFRKLVSDMLGRSLPLSKIQLWPKKLEACIAEKTALLTLGQRKNCITYFVGFQVDTLRMRGNQLNVELQMAHFREWELARFQPLIPGMDVLVKSFECQKLPKICFEIYEGGKDAAMNRRRMLRDTDPKRQERRRLRKLEELKAKMAEIQKKKQDKLDEEESARKKRKLSDADLDESETELESKAVKIEQIEQDVPAEEEKDQQPAEPEFEEEADLLESALDAIQDAALQQKTREEAEADRMKLLAGEPLEEGDYAPSDDEDLGYTGGADARQTVLMKPIIQESSISAAQKDIRALPLAEDEAEILRKAGYTVVSDVDEDTKIIGGNMPAPFRSRPEGQKEAMGKVKIVFRTKFDVVQLDANGHIVDKGDDDYAPSKKWAGRKAGFEFKLGERGLGYYRTGKKVIIPSNTAY